MSRHSNKDNTSTLVYARRQMHLEDVLTCVSIVYIELNTYI